MKVSGSWILLLVLGSVLLVFLTVSSSSTNGSFFPGNLLNRDGDGRKVIAISRKLKENSYTPSAQKKRNAGKVNLDDYHSIDPSPSSKASIKPGPIEHGAPLNPFIPKPSPPAHPNPGGAP